MANHSSTHERSLESAHDLYRHLAPNPSLKGLLKPFKGKGDYEDLAHLARETQDKLLIMQKHLVNLTEHYQVAHKRMTLRLHKAPSGQFYLRWRTLGNAPSNASGARLWHHVVSDPLTSSQTRQNLLILERQRIALNLQACCVQSMIKQARQGLAGLAVAERIVSDLTSIKST